VLNGLILCTFNYSSGPEFQTRIRQNEQNNPKFNFLNTGDPYHAYYQHKVKEFKENEGKSKLLNSMIKGSAEICLVGYEKSLGDL
jgi:hypothetical protein